MSILEYKTGCGRELGMAGLEMLRAFFAGFLNLGLAALTAAFLVVLIPYADTYSSWWSNHRSNWRTSDLPGYCPCSS